MFKSLCSFVRSNGNVNRCFLCSSLFRLMFSFSFLFGNSDSDSDDDDYDAEYLDIFRLIISSFFFFFWKYGYRMFRMFYSLPLLNCHLLLMTLVYSTRLFWLMYDRTCEFFLNFHLFLFLFWKKNNVSKIINFDN